VLGLNTESTTPDDSSRRLWGDGFEVETLINIRIAQAGLAIDEVPSYEHSRIHGVSNLNAFSDGLRVLRTILAERCHSKSRKRSATEAMITPRYAELRPACLPAEDLTSVQSGS
jgi:hypothetical protein